MSESDEEALPLSELVAETSRKMLARLESGLRGAECRVSYGVLEAMTKEGLRTLMQVAPLPVMVIDANAATMISPRAPRSLDKSITVLGGVWTTEPGSLTSLLGDKSTTFFLETVIEEAQEAAVNYNMKLKTQIVVLDLAREVEEECIEGQSLALAFPYLYGPNLAKSLAKDAHVPSRYLGSFPGSSTDYNLLQVLREAVGYAALHQEVEEKISDQAPALVFEGSAEVVACNIYDYQVETGAYSGSASVPDAYVQARTIGFLLDPFPSIFAQYSALVRGEEGWRLAFSRDDMMSAVAEVQQAVDDELGLSPLTAYEFLDRIPTYRERYAAWDEVVGYARSMAATSVRYGRGDAWQYGCDYPFEMDHEENYKDDKNVFPFHCGSIAFAREVLNDEKVITGKNPEKESIAFQLYLEGRLEKPDIARLATQVLRARERRKDPLAVYQALKVLSLQGKFRAASPEALVVGKCAAGLARMPLQDALPATLQHARSSGALVRTDAKGRGVGSKGGRSLMNNAASAPRSAPLSRQTRVRGLQLRRSPD